MKYWTRYSSVFPLNRAAPAAWTCIKVHPRQPSLVEIVHQGLIDPQAGVDELLERCTRRRQVPGGDPVLRASVTSTDALKRSVTASQKTLD